MAEALENKYNEVDILRKDYEVLQSNINTTHATSKVTHEIYA